MATRPIPAGLYLNLRSHQEVNYQPCGMTLVTKAILPECPDTPLPDALADAVEEFYRSLWPLYGVDNDANVRDFQLDKPSKGPRQRPISPVMVLAPAAEKKKRSRSPVRETKVSEDPFAEYRKRTSTQARLYRGPQHCQYFASKEGCRKGNRCPFLHEL